ncbi:MAG: hypothetical protein KDC92_17620, partial [Bacteroidetes bacterium]|nr:hypothetical protein [Bacteroidota bacterium]
MIRETKYWISGFLLLIALNGILGTEGAFWSVHHFMHFPVFIILALFALFGIILYTNKGNKLLEKVDAKSKIWMILVLAGILFIIAPTASDAYGDARNTIKNFSNYNGDDAVGTLLRRIFNLDLFRLHSGEYFYLNLAKLVMKTVGTDAHQTFRMLAFVFGIGTLGIWGFYFKQLKQNKHFTLFCLLIGLLAFQNFHGHAEIYSAAIFFNSCLLVFGIISIKVCNRYFLAVAAIALVFA